MSAGLGIRTSNVDGTSNEAFEPVFFSETQSSRQTRHEGYQMSGPDDPGWLDSCLQYFEAKYQQRVRNWSDEPFGNLLGVPVDASEVKYTLPEAVPDDKIMRYLLNDRLFYLAFFSMEMSKLRRGASYELILWEMFGMNPGYLLELCLGMRAYGPGEVYGQSFVERYLVSMLQTDVSETPATFESFLRLIDHRLTAPSLNPSHRLKLRLLRERLLELQQDLLAYGLGAAWLRSYEELGCETNAWGVQLPLNPLHTGLQHYLQKKKEGLLKSVLHHSLNQLPPLHDLAIQMTDAVPGIPSGVEPKLIPNSNGSATLLFDTAGTGKTTAIHNVIRLTYGFYCLSPNLLPSDVRVVNSVIAPDRACASRDTYSMYDDFKALGKFDLGSQSWRQFLSHASHLGENFPMTKSLDAARNYLLETFKRIESQRSSNDRESRLKWLQLQISCWPGNDPFDVAYRLVRLQTHQMPHEIAVQADFTNTIWAFDEAQHALGDPLASEILSEKLQHSWGYHHYLSGTSLDLRKMQTYLDNTGITIEETHPPQKMDVLDHGKFLEIVRRHTWNIVKELYALQSRNCSARASENFPLLSRGGKALGFTVELPKGSWEDVQTSLLQWYIFKMNEDDSNDFKKFLDQIEKDHSMFLGRIRWTTLFAEELLRASPAVGGRLTAQHVKDTTKRVAQEIKRSLKDRIDQLKDTHYLDELYWTAMEADVFSMTRIFPDEESVKFISEGFALVHEDSKVLVNEGGGKYTDKVVKGRLQEPLAVKAVMEYLREPKNNHMYDKLIDRFFANLHLDRGKGGGLGKMAEFVFTAKLDNFLRDTNDEIAKHRRRMFLGVIESAQGKISGTTAGEAITDLQEYFLVDTGVQTKLDVNENPQNFFRRPRPSNFVLPEQDEGPDLYFFLEKPGTLDRILFAMSFKTGTPDPGKDNVIRRALRTLALKPWKSGDLNQCPVIHVYVASAVDIDELKFNSCLDSNLDAAKTKGWDRSKLRDNDFICHMDRQRTKDVWGETFQALLEFMKELR